MGLIVNPRGASGAGKTELARRILAAYGWRTCGDVEPIYGAGRARPIAYRLCHPLRRRPLVVLGHYERTSGGCDTIRLTDGGLDEVFRLAGDYAGSGHDVLLEGSAISVEHHRSAALAAAHALHILRLDTPAERCAHNLIMRRRIGRDGKAPLARMLAMETRAVEGACARLRSSACIELVDFDRALERARDLLELTQATQRTAGAP